MNYLLDTCVVSDFFKKTAAVIEHFELISPRNIYVSTITVMEVEYGLKLNPEVEKKIRPLWEALLKQIHTLSYSVQCAEASALARAVLKKGGLMVGPYDILIAGTAIAHGMTMVTSNIKEFERIPKILIQDWRKK